MVFAALPELALAPLATDRGDEFDRVVRAFLAACQQTPLSQVAAPPDLDDPRYERARDIHAVALAGCLDLETTESAEAGGAPLPRHRHRQRDAG